jgi:DNA polymerase III delta prime subunit
MLWMPVFLLRRLFRHLQSRCVHTLMDLSFPPPHYILFEPLNDKKTLEVWNNYKHQYPNCEYELLDASINHSVETFAPWIEDWMSRLPSKQTRFRILLILHAEFLTFSCQQVLRRLLEQRSFRCRVWFHIEDPTGLQPAIQSRCIIKRISTYSHPIKYKIL